MGKYWKAPKKVRNLLRGCSARFPTEANMKYYIGQLPRAKGYSQRSTNDAGRAASSREASILPMRCTGDGASGRSDRLQTLGHIARCRLFGACAERQGGGLRQLRARGAGTR